MQSETLTSQSAALRQEAPPLFKLSKSERLLSRNQFQYVRKSGRLFETSTAYIAWRSLEKNPPKAGITLSRKFGIACMRNYVRRKYREALRHLPIPTGLWFEIRPRKKAQSASLPEIKSDILRFIAHASPTHKTQ